MNLHSPGSAALQLENVLIEPANHSLLEQLKDYAAAATRLGFNNPLWSEKALSALMAMPIEKKTFITQHLKLWVSWIEECQAKKGILNDLSLLNTALDYYGLAIDDELRKTIDLDTVVEIYSEEMFQMYRSFKMLSMTGYSLLDLCAHEWFILWERPQLTIQQMHNDVINILKTEAPMVRATVTPHIIKETFNTGLTEPFVPRNAYVHFQYIGFLKRLRPDSPRAFICTSKGSILSEDVAENNQIAFL